MILPATAANSIFVEHAQTGHCLSVSRIRALVPETASDKFAGQGRDSAETLHEVQNHTLAGKNDTRIVADHGNRLTVMQADAIENFRMAGHFVV